MATVLSKYSETEELGGGRNKLELHLRPISFERNGYSRRITDVLANSGAQDLTIGTDELVQFRLRDKLSGNAPLVHFGAGSSHVRFTPLGTNNVNAVVKGNTTTFPGAWNGADLKLSIGGHILRKEITLKAGHPRTFSFRIDDHQGLDLKSLQTADFRIHEPYLEGPQNQLIPLKWVQTIQGGKTVLTVTLPLGDYTGWTLDPTLTLQPDAAAGIDTFIRASAATTNYGTNAVVIIGESNDAVGEVQRLLIKFDLSSIPDNATLSSVILSLFCSADYSSNARTLRVFRLKRNWVETQATWNIYSTGNNWSTAGGFHADDCEQIDIGTKALSATETTSQFKDITLTPITKAALDLGNGWLLKVDTETDDAYQYRSSDHATAGERPKLAIVYSTPSYIPRIMRHFSIPQLGVK